MIMIKNKDGSYNKFRLLIISLIFIITISITGFYIVENIELPKIETPSWTTPTQTPTPTPTLTSIPIDPSIALLYNSSNITYDSNTTWNVSWSYTNYTNTSDWNWTYPPAMSNNFTYYVGGGGSGGSSANISYTVIVGGGGGGAGYTSVAYTNSTPVVPINKPTPQETLNASQVISPIIFPMMEMWWFPIIFIIPLIFLTTSLRSSKSMVLILLFGVIGFNFFFSWGSIIFIIISMTIMLFLILDIFRDYHDDYYDR